MPKDFELKYLGTSGILKFLWIVNFVFIATLCRGFLNKPNQWERINIAVQIPVSIILFALFGPWAILYYLLSTYFGFGIHPVSGHWIHEHYLFNKRQETYSYYGPLNAVTFNVGYHNEHHDFPRVPGWRLPELREIGKDVYGQLDSDHSWLAVWWRFIKDPTMGHHRRMVRTWDIFLKAKQERTAQARTER